MSGEESQETWMHDNDGKQKERRKERKKSVLKQAHTSHDTGNVIF